MTITTEMVKELRQRTGAGVLECKKVLEETSGDMDRAMEILHERGLAKAAKKVEREAKDGLIEAYVHPGGRLASLIEVNCETDFVARTPDFKELVHDLAMQVVATNPRYVAMADVPADVLEQEQGHHRAQLASENKSPQMIEEIVAGRMAKFYAEACLLQQPFIKDEGKTVQDLITEKIAKLGENIRVKRFARFELGE